MHTPCLDQLPPSVGTWLEIDLTEQRLYLCEGQVRDTTYVVSTGAAGTGQYEGSGQTPAGWHYIRAMIGAGMPVGTVFRGRRPTGEVYVPGLSAKYPGRDWILTRILWLCGLEPGWNRGGQVDSQRRYIYLHGTPPDEPMGIPASHGCVRLRDPDLLDVFDRVTPGTPVWLHD
ncbi:L,D-transpeptidase [Aidingimonas halophila]|uniref:L,D-transpeptidase catalytic domain n=1 Tax=Aidingimonas halophila TaxID=574349 RepID=A0A1H3B6S3_9GAMM|nr:L,D-transpeptidase [Aidingimonas halophila]GHC25879.1 peptidase [Aidingimonas halophila]SDX36749.1 L,D-transpeptidase catalytic domain [Aidingimonas halophila]